MCDAISRLAVWAAGFIFSVVMLAPLALAETIVPDPFVGRPLVFPKVHADPSARFQIAEKSVVGWNRTGTIASVQISPTIKANIDAWINEVHFPSTIELTNSKSGTTLAKFDVFDMDDAFWYFPGNGTFYISQQQLNLCGPRVLRKFEAKGDSLVETTQALWYLGVRSRVVSSAKLYSSPENGSVVATAPEGSTVIVVGMLPQTRYPGQVTLLVTTSLGLTGWFSPLGDLNGQLDVHLCN